MDEDALHTSSLDRRADVATDSGAFPTKRWTLAEWLAHSVVNRRTNLWTIDNVSGFVGRAIRSSVERRYDGLCVSVVSGTAYGTNMGQSGRKVLL